MTVKGMKEIIEALCEAMSFDDVTNLQRAKMFQELAEKHEEWAADDHPEPTVNNEII